MAVNYRIFYDVGPRRGTISIMVAIRARLFGCFVCAAVVAWAASAYAAGDDIPEAAAKLRTQYAADLEQLAKWCESNGLKEEARKTRRVLSPSDPYKLYVPILPDAVGPAKLSADAPPKVVEWNERLDKLRQDNAMSFYELARRAVRNGYAGLAFQLVLDAVQANPDCEPARRVLGYQKFHDQWCTFYEAKKLRAGFVWNQKFGWLLKGHERRYEAGQRFSDGHWISAEEDARRHSDIRTGWNIETEHYAIRTNASIEQAVALGVKLERLNRLWQRIFIRYYASESDVVALFDGRLKTAMGSPSRHSVFYYRDRNDYNRSLRPVMPNIEISIGFYRDMPGRAYFFVGKECDDRTMYHEATHQLFHESKLVASNVGGRGNFWIVEGIAMFMESLRQEDGYYVLGGFDDERLHAASYRRLHDDFYVPLAEFVDFDMEKLQKDPRISKLYSQAAGLTHFLIFNDGGRYRDALVAYLLIVYAGRDNHDTLAKLTGKSYGELDKQYREFLEKDPSRTTKPTDHE